MDTDQAPGLSVYAAALKRRQSVMLAVALPVTAFGILLALALPSIYMAPATFQFEAPAIAEQHAAQHNNNNYEDEYVSRLTDAVLTRENLQAMREALRASPEARADQSETAGKIRKSVRVEMVTERILDPQSGRQKDVNTGFTVAFQARTATEAQKASEWLANRFIATSRELRRSRDLQTAEFLGVEAEHHRDQIALLESKLADFKSKHYDELPESAQLNMQSKERLEQDANNINQEIRALQQNRTFMEMQLQQALAHGGDNAAVAQLEEEYQHKSAIYDRNHPDMLALRKRIEAARRTGAGRPDTTLKAQLETQKSILAEARQRYSEDHPDVKRLEREIANLEARVASGEGAAAPRLELDPVVVQLQTQLRGTDNQIATLQARNAELRSKQRQIEGHLGSSPQVEKDYQVLTRGLALARDEYDRLLKQKMDTEFAAAASLAGSGDEFRLTGSPTVPLAPAKPARIAIGLIGLILGLILAAITALGAEAVDQTVRGSRDVVGLLGVTPTAIVPEIRNSILRARLQKRTATLAASAAVGLPVAYLLIYLVVR